MWSSFTGLAVSLNTHKDTIEETDVRIGDKTYKLKESVDIGGGNDFVGEEYEKLIQNKDFVIFIFNAEKIMNSDLEEINQVRARLIKLGQILRRSMADNKLLQVHIIGSHLDKVLKNKNEYNKKADEIIRKIEEKYFKELLNFDKEKHLVLLDLTTKDLVDKYKEKTFKK